MDTLFGQSVPFYKMQGCGNDFVIIDNRELNIPTSVMSKWAIAICRKSFGIGADGLFFIENSQNSDQDFKWQFYNSDGSRAEMCGNASRCAGKLAHKLGIAGVNHTFGTDAGSIKVEVFEDLDEIKVQLTTPVDTVLNQELTIDGETYAYHFSNTGVPHCVVPVEDLDKINVQKLGKQFRYHEAFAPAGTNVNFVSIKDKKNLNVRTYERGVEEETYACGTGVSAVQVTLNKLGLTDSSVAIKTSGGEILKVIAEGESIFLQGAAELTFKGDLYLKPLGLSL